jgi:parallel beta-helix repeat protein
MRKAAFTLILICLMASGVVCVRPITAQSQNDITINADGTVTPSTAPIQQAGNTYTLTSKKIVGNIEVRRNNAVIDGNASKLLGGLSLYGVLNVTVKNFIILAEFDKSTVGISLADTSNVLVANNTITGFESVEAWNGGLYSGIDVEGGGSNIIAGNNLMYNLIGISLSNTSFNQIVGNNITGDWAFSGGLYSSGIYFVEASNNTVYHNNFANSTFEAMGSGSVNVWDNGYPSGGNYWSEYQTRYPNARQIGSSGVGDTPYVIDANNTDHYPLMEPFTGAFHALQTAPPEISLGSPLNQTYNDSSIALTFSVDVLSPVNAVNWTGYSLDGEPNVTVTGGGALANVTLADVANGVHNVTVYANDTYGNMASETVTFKVAKPQPFPTVLVATASGVAIAVIVVGLLVYFKKRKNARA